MNEGFSKKTALRIVGVIVEMIFITRGRLKWICLLMCLGDSFYF